MLKSILNYAITSHFCSPLRLSNLVLCNFSSFKTKFEKLQSADYQKINDFYDSLIQFENNLDQLQKIKYRKAVQNLNKKINRIIRRQSQKQLSDKNQIISQSFSTTISHELFYEMQTQKYKPINQNMIINKKSLKQLYNSSKLLLQNNFNLIYQHILSNPQNNTFLYDKIKQRCEYFQEQLCLSIYQQYENILKQNQQAKNMQKYDRNALKKLRESKKGALFNKDFKFILNEGLTAEQNYMASEISKILCKYGFSTDKIMTFSLKSLSNQGYRSLTPASMANHLFILGYHKVQIIELNDKLFKIFQILSKLSDNNSVNHQKIQKIGPFQSFLFYLLSNKIQMYELFKDIVVKLKTNYIKSKQYQNSNDNKNKIETCILQKQIFYIMMKLLNQKYELNIQKIDVSSILSNYKTNTFDFDLQKLYQSIPKISSNAHTDFQRYLTKKLYKFQKSTIQHSHNKQNSHTNTLTQDTVYKIQQKNFICMNLPKIMEANKKPNGIGQLVLQNYKVAGQTIKIINPLVVNQCEKWGEKQQYFKSKLKGIAEPEINRSRRFDF